MQLGSKMVCFIGVLAGAYIYIGNAIPQIQASSTDDGDTAIGTTPEALVTAGKRIFTSDKAQCLTCHSIGEDPKARCPNQEGLGGRAPGRRPGMSGAEYLVESTYDPNAYIVAGYPKNQMKPIHKAPIALSHDEILAVIAFLNTLGGTTDAAFIDAVKLAQDPWRKGHKQPGADADEEVPLPVLAGDAARGRALFATHACNSCHSVAGMGPETCPDLTAIGGSQSGEYILESIVDPSAVIVKGYTQVNVAWKKTTKGDVSGVPIRWEPSKAAPERLVLSVTKAGVQVERVIPIDRVLHVGDSTLILNDEDETILYGELVAGTKATGVTLRLLESGRWVEKRFPTEQIDVFKPPASPMPTNFADAMTPQQIFDLVAYLLEQKGTTE